MSGSIVKVLFVAADTEGCGYARCFLPALGLNEIGGFEAKATIQLAWDDFLHHDVVVWARQHQSDLVRYREFLKGMGKVLVYEIDDYLHGIPTWNPASQKYPKGGSELRGIGEWMAACHGLSVSTEPLARAYAGFNPRVAVLPNSLDLSRWHPVENRGRGLRLGWIGSITHRRDLEEVRSVLKSILRTYSEVRLVMMGYDGGLRREGLDIEFHPFVPIEEYPGALAELRLDVAIAPLCPHRFNTSKSHIKYLEYSALGIPCVASRMEPYLLIRHGETGFLASSHQEWKDCLAALIEDADLRSRIGRAARDYVAREFDIRKTARLWGDFFVSLIDSNPRRATSVSPGALLCRMHLLRAVEAARDRRGDEALRHLRNARASDPQNAAARILLAETLAAAGEMREALEEARAALQIGDDEVIRARACRIIEARPDPARPTPSGTG